MLIFLLAFAGIALIYAEFFLPGGIFAVLGGASLIAGCTLCFIQASALWGGLYLLLLLLAVIGTCQFALWKIRFSKTKDRFYLEKDQEGYVAASFNPQFIGKTGIVATELKPAGHILVEDCRYQALSETGFFSKGETVEIIGGQGSHLIVRTPSKRIV